MIKKLLFICILFFAFNGFSQQKSVQKLTASPNPFLKSTTISFKATSNQVVIVSIKNVLGKIVYLTKINAHIGTNTVPFHRKNLKSGIYIYTIQKISSE